MPINRVPSSSTCNSSSPQDLIFRKEAFAKAKERVAYEQIIKACEKFGELKRSGSETEADEVRKLISNIVSNLKICPPDSNPHQNTESDDESANRSNQLLDVDRSIHKLYRDPKFEHTSFERIKVSFLGLPFKLKLCLLCFLNFPEKAIIKKRSLIYWWIGMGILPPSITPYRQTEKIGQDKTAEDFGNVFLDELIAKGFIEPFYKNCSPFLDRCRMHPLVRSVLTTLADSVGFDLVRSASTTLANSVDFNPDEFRCWLNVDEDVIDDSPELFAKMKHIKILYLGRWKSSTKHHIEIANTEFFDGLKNMTQLSFLCLRGISLIEEIPEFISQLTTLKILDLRACHNLEVIPKGIGLLKSLTHLDMSECYFLDHMPESLASLSELQVLKGFFIGASKGKKSCTLKDLAKLPKLRKLNIYTSLKAFPSNNQLIAFQEFKALRKLTISWGGCSSQVETDTGKQPTDTEPEPTAEPSAGLPSQLEKLDLQGFPGRIIPSWLRAANLKQLKKLYIRGGQLHDLKEGIEAEQGADRWEVETLRLKYLSELEIDGNELRRLFPKLIFAQIAECPKITSCPCDMDGVWINRSERRA